jgi:hypothetical protein
MELSGIADISLSTVVAERVRSSGVVLAETLAAVNSRMAVKRARIAGSFIVGGRPQRIG